MLDAHKCSTMLVIVDPRFQRRSQQLRRSRRLAGEDPELEGGDFLRAPSYHGINRFAEDSPLVANNANNVVYMNMLGEVEESEEVEEEEDIGCCCCLPLRALFALFARRSARTFEDAGVSSAASGASASIIAGTSST
jgi:hypothetical protein